MELRITAARAGRLSSFLLGELKMSTGLMNKLKWGDSIRVNGIPQHTNYPVQPGDVIGLYRVVGVLWQAVHPDGISPFQLVHQSGGHFQLPQQKRGQPSGPGGCDSQFHPITSCTIQV